MAAVERPVAPRPVTRGVFQLARALELTPEQAAGLGEVAATLDELAATDAADVARATRVDGERARRLVTSARLARLPGLTPALAAELTGRGITIRELADDVTSVLEKLRGLPELDEGRVIGWAVSAVASESVRDKGDRDPFPPLESAASARVPETRQLVLDQDDTWKGIAQRLYGARGERTGSRAAALAAANRSPVDASLRAGAVIVLPEAEALSETLPPVAQAASALRDFAPYLSADEAEALAQAGIVEPRLLPAVATLPEGSVAGVEGSRLQQLALHARLAALPQMPPEVAAHLAQQHRDLASLAGIHPRELLASLEQAQGRGLVRDDTALTLATTVEWIGKLVGGMRPLDGVLALETSVCDTTLGPSTFLENYYTYRFAPAGRTSEELQQEFNGKGEWLAEVDDYLAGAADAQRTAAFVDRGLRVGRLAMSDVLRWGGSSSATTSTDTLTLLRDFMRENARIVQLLGAVTEGNEAYRHRQYGLALSCYARAESWFASSVDAKWYQNSPGAGGQYKPTFLALYESNPTSPSAQAAFKPVDEFYRQRAALPEGADTLDGLQVELDDYHTWRIHPAVASSNVAPFRKYLYYLAGFMLPMLRADCHARLGNFCGALDDYFRVLQEPSFTQPVDGGKEQTMATTVRGAAGGPAFRSLTSYATAPASGTRYHGAYLHAIEKRVLRLRVAEALLAWGDVHYRRRETAAAEGCYAQVLRILYRDWDALRTISFTDAAAYGTQVAARGVNPRAGELAVLAHQQLLKLDRGLNFLGYSDQYVPIWTYNFLLTSARYFAERARQLGRDALQFLGAAEQEMGNRRLLLQGAAIAQGQLAVESRRVDEAQLGVSVAESGVALADQRTANNASRREELDNFGPTRQALGVVGGAIGGASTGASLGGQAGGAFAAGGAILGATYGGVSAYISSCIELQMQKNEFERQRLELQTAQGMAQAELSRAQVGVSVAQLSRNVAALGTLFAQANLAYAQSKTLSAEFWFANSLRLSEMAATYLERAIGVSFLAEQAFEFMEGRRLDVIRFDYSQSEGVLSADALLSDLDSIEYERVSGRLAKTMPVKHVVRLREKDFLGFAELKRTGTITFDTPLFDFDQSHPGSYHQRVASVEVEVRALVPPGGIRGTLQKSGLSYLRYRAPRDGGGAPRNSAPDWVQYTPTPFRLAPVIQSDETLILSAFDTRADGIVLRPDPGEQLRIFEGSGVGSTWTLSIRPFANDFDFSTITDVNLVIYYYSQYDEDLERAIILERRKLLGRRALALHRTRGFSLGEMYPDALYFLQNPRPGAGDPWRERRMTIEVTDALFPPNQLNRRATGITMVFFDDAGLVDVHAGLSAQGIALAAGDFRAAPGLHPMVRAADPAGHTPVGTWTLTLRATDNAAALTQPGTFEVDAQGAIVTDEVGAPVPDAGGVRIFDPAALAALRDVWVIFDYTYEEAGSDGEPLVFWAHYAAGGGASYIDNAGAVKQVPSWSVANLGGNGAWAVVSGRLTQSAANSESIDRPNIATTLGDLSIETDLLLPPAVGSAGGVVLRYDAAAPSYYLAKIERPAANRLTISLQRVAGGAPVVLQTVDSTALAPSGRFALGLRARGGTLELYLSGRRMLTASDGALANGSFGLYARGAGVSFGDVLVSDLSGR